MFTLIDRHTRGYYSLKQSSLMEKFYFVTNALPVLLLTIFMNSSRHTHQHVDSDPLSQSLAVQPKVASKTYGDRSFSFIRPIYIGKNQNPKNLGFCCTVYTARKTHNIQSFWHEKCMRKKTWISYLCFGKWCACATSLYLWPYTCSAHYVVGRGRVIPLKVRYHVTKNPNNTGEIGARTSEILAEF